MTVKVEQLCVYTKTTEFYHLKGWVLWYMKRISKKDVIFLMLQWVSEQHFSRWGPQSIILPVVTDLGGTFSRLPPMTLYYKYIFGVDHDNSYLKCIKCRPEQGNGLNYFPKWFPFPGFGKCIALSFSLRIYELWCCYFTAAPFWFRDSRGGIGRKYEVVSDHFVTLTNIKSTMKQLGIFNCWPEPRLCKMSLGPLLSSSSLWANQIVRREDGTQVLLK